MIYKRLAVSCFLVTFSAPCFAHRLDEYLQATLVSVEKARVDASVRLVPSVAVAPSVLAIIDTNGDGAITGAEQNAYAHRVVGDLTMRVDGRRSAPRLNSVEFPPIEQIKEGLGQIEIQLSADLPEGSARREIVIENHHFPSISVYLMNCLAPRDRHVKIMAQNRNRNQSTYRIDYEISGDGSRRPSHAIGFASIFRLGMRHIADGTDHLLFLLALLLPAPLTVFASRWSGPDAVRHSIVRILKVVTAFTVGHSITLAAAGLGFVHVPSRPVEVFIAASILISAIHALRPLFPGKEPRVAAFFGLVHGLAFATTIQELGLDRRERILSILAFNLGIEAMQLVAIAATMPSLLLLSRTRAYSSLRIAGAIFAGVAAAGWLGERLLGIHARVDEMVNALAHQGIWVAALLLLCGIASLFLPTRAENQSPSRSNRDAVESLPLY